MMVMLALLPFFSLSSILCIQPICTVSLITFLWHVFILRVRHFPANAHSHSNSNTHIHIHTANGCVSMPSGFEANNSRCVLMSFFLFFFFFLFRLLFTSISFSLAHTLAHSIRYFDALPLNYSNAMSIEFEIERNGISICTCVSYEKRELSSMCGKIDTHTHAAHTESHRGNTRERSFSRLTQMEFEFCFFLLHFANFVYLFRFVILWID